MQQHSFSKLRFCSFLKDVCSARSTPHHFVPLLPCISHLFYTESSAFPHRMVLFDQGKLAQRSSNHWQNHWDVQYQKLFVDSPPSKYFNQIKNNIFLSEGETSLLITLKMFQDFVHSVFICKTFACNQWFVMHDFQSGPPVN